MLETSKKEIASNLLKTQRRVISFFSYDDSPKAIAISKALEILLTYIVQDELIEVDDIHSVMGDYNVYTLTEKGKEFISKWINADAVE